MRTLQNMLKLDLILGISNYKFDRPLPKEINKKAIELKKDQLGRKIMRKFFGLIAKPIVTWQMTVVKMKKQKAQKSES